MCVCVVCVCGLCVCVRERERGGGFPATAYKNNLKNQDRVVQFSSFPSSNGTIIQNCVCVQNISASVLSANIIVSPLCYVFVDLASTVI